MANKKKPATEACLINEPLVYASEDEKKIVISVVGTETTIRLSPEKAMAFAEIIMEQSRSLYERLLSQ